MGQTFRPICSRDSEIFFRSATKNLADPRVLFVFADEHWGWVFLLAVAGISFFQTTWASGVPACDACKFEKSIQSIRAAGVVHPLN